MDLKTEFVSEANDHCAAAEEAVLSLEHCTPEECNQAINRLFRALHSIKGGAACVELIGVKELAHALESVVGLIRAGTLVIEAELAQLLLDGIDNLKTCINSGNDEVGDPGIISHCKAVVNSVSEKPSKSIKNKNEIKRIFDISRYDTSIISERSLHLYEITLDIAAECKRSKCRVADLIQNLASVGTILASTEAIETLAECPIPSSPWSLLLATIIDDSETLFLGLEIKPISFYLYSSDEIPITPPTASNERAENVAHGGHTASMISDTTMSCDEPTVSTQYQDTSAKKIESQQKHIDAKSSPEQTVRLPIEIIDKLMNLAGELVVVRNRNAQVLAAGNERELSTVNQRLDTVTSEIQATVMRTRMCPVGGVFGRFSRVVRDLSKQLGKEMELEISGADVELDKSIVDGLFEPLTHLVRNSADHGLESPAERQRSGKSAIGHIHLSASHQTGQVFIRVIDDGKGIDPQKIRVAAVKKGILSDKQVEVMSDRELVELIFLPGFSTAETLTDVSGRGVGMDAVKSALQKIGGIVEIQSAPGKGTSVTIRLPLTLAILPALILAVENQCFAIPQVNVVEVVWLHGDEIYQSIRIVDEKEIYWLREKMLPLIRLSKVLKIKNTYKDPITGNRKPDRRTHAPDRRQRDGSIKNEKRKGARDRRTSIENSLYIIVLRIGSDRFGVCTDRIIDTEEIVVKPLHDKLKICPVYAGVTVLGDGVTSLILDIPELAKIGGVRYEKTETAPLKERATSDEPQKMLLFALGKNERFAIPLSLLMRVDEINSREIQTSGGREYILFRNSVIPLMRIERVVEGLSSAYGNNFLYAIIPRIGKPIGIAAAQIIDIVDIDSKIESALSKKKAIIGTQLVDGLIVSILDVCVLIETLEPGWLLGDTHNKAVKKKMILVDDSPFFCSFIGSYLRGIGFEVVIATNGKEALDLLNRESAAIDGIISDIEMPVLNGFDLARKMKGNVAFSGIPLLGISAIEDSIMRNRAIDAGFDEFQVKNDLQAIAGAFSDLLTKAKKK